MRITSNSEHASGAFSSQMSKRIASAPSRTLRRMSCTRAGLYVCTARRSASVAAAHGTLSWYMLRSFAMLACARIGAAHSVIFGGFSATAIVDRVHDAKSRVILTCDGAWRRGSVVPLKANVDEACR